MCSLPSTYPNRKACCNKPHGEKRFSSKGTASSQRHGVQTGWGSDRKGSNWSLKPFGSYPPFSLFFSCGFWVLFTISVGFGDWVEIDVIEEPEANFDSSASKKNNSPNLLCHPVSPLTMEFHWAQRIQWRRHFLWCCIHVVLCEKCLPKFPFPSYLSLILVPIGLWGI